MKLQILSKTDGDLFGGANIAVTWDFNDIAGYTSAAAQNVLAILAGTKAQCLGMKLNTAFDVSGTGALTIQVGDTGSANSLLASTVIAVDGTEILYAIGGSAKAYVTADTIQATFTDATSMAYTVGSVTVYLFVRNLNDLPI